MQLPQTPDQIGPKRGEFPCQPLAPADQNIVETRFSLRRHDVGGQGTQTSLDPVAIDGARKNLFCHGQSDTHGPAGHIFPARRALNDQAFGDPLSLGTLNAQKIRPLFQAVHDIVVMFFICHLSDTALPISARTALGAQALAAMCAAARQHLTAVFRGHAGAKAVTAFTDQFARLVSAFHRFYPQS